MNHERKQIAFLGCVVALCLVLLVGYYYYSVKSVNIYNVESTVYVVPETFVPEEERININTATEEELESLPGIGETLAERIIEYRNEHGSFTTIYDLSLVKGISDSKVDDIKPYIKING